MIFYLVVPVGSAQGTRNTPSDVVRIRAVAPIAKIDVEYVERNRAPGTEGASPQLAVVSDTRTGKVEPLVEA